MVHAFTKVMFKRGLAHLLASVIMSQQVGEFFLVYITSLLGGSDDLLGDYLET